MGVTARIVATLLTVCTFGPIAALGGLRCSGDTDGCDPSWANGALVVWGLVAGLFLLARAWTGVSAGRFYLEAAACFAVAVLITQVG